MALCLIFSLNYLAFAAETDQITCRVEQEGCTRTQLELKDSRATINQWIYENAQAILDEINKQQWVSPHKVLLAMGNGLGEMHVKLAPIEAHVLLNLNLYDHFSTGRGVYKTSDYSEMGIGSWFPLFPTIKISGVLLGLDKLGHFFSQGWDYMKLQLDLQRNAPRMSQEEANKKIKQFGIELEKGIYGLRMSGVFSFADLVANWQGYELYKNLVYGDNPHLTLSKDGYWVWNRIIDLGEYVRDEMDEVINPNVYYASTLSLEVFEVIVANCRHYFKDPDKFMNRQGKPMTTQYLPDDIEWQIRREFPENAGWISRKDFSVEYTCNKLPR